MAGPVISAASACAGTAALPYGWRISLGLAMEPAAFFALGSLCLPDTPHSVLYRNPANAEHARQVRAEAAHSA